MSPSNEEQQGPSTLQTLKTRFKGLFEFATGGTSEEIIESQRELEDYQYNVENTSLSIEETADRLRELREDAGLSEDYNTALYKAYRDRAVSFMTPTSDLKMYLEPYMEEGVY